MRASRTWIIPEADIVNDVESTIGIDVIASPLQSGGVCDAGMHEMAQPRNLGGPAYSLLKSKNKRRKRACFDDMQEVRLLHSTEEVR